MSRLVFSAMDSMSFGGLMKLRARLPTAIGNVWIDNGRTWNAKSPRVAPASSKEMKRAGSSMTAVSMLAK
jgi:hypothetical protein